MKNTIPSFLLLLFIIMGTSVVAQNKTSEKQFSVKLHGSVKVTTYYDSRASVAARNGHIYLWPQKPEPDAEGNDLNAEGRYDIDAAHTRFSLAISAPDILGAKSSAMIETDFLGSSGNGRDMVLRLRHAFVRLDWEKSSLTAGQTWHPLFLTENYPGTVNLGVGSPFHPINRQPQIRYEYRPSTQLKFLIYAMSQNDFGDVGMPDALEKSLSPELALQVKYSNKAGLFAALSAGYKSLRPLVQDPYTKTLTKETAQSIYMAVSLQQKMKPITVKTEAIYGGGLSNLVMIGGFAEKVSTQEQRQYTPIQTLSLWTDIHSNSKKWQPGLFAGYTKNLGTKEQALPIPGYARGNDIASVYAVAARIKYFTSPKISMGAEWMYSTANYGSEYDNHVRPTVLSDVSNHRITLSVNYTF